MKRTLLLAGCLLLCAGCAKKAAPPSQPTDGYSVILKSCLDIQTGRIIPCPDEPQSKPLPPQKKAAKWSDILKPLPDQNAVEMDIPAGLPPMVAPMPLKCPKGYVEAWLFSYEEANVVCVTPAFIAELKKANGEK